MAFTVTTGANTGGVTTGTVAVAVPGGSAASGDLLIAVFESQTGSPGPNLTGWTMTQTTQLAGLSGTTRLTIGIRIADGSEGATQTFTCPATNNHTSGQMLKVAAGTHGCTAVGDVVVGTATSGATGTAISGVAGITVTAGSLILLIGASALDTTSTTQFSAYTNTDPGGSGWTEIFDNLNATGNGGGIGAAYGVCAGTTTGTGSITQANTTDSWWGIQIGIKPAAGGGTNWTATPADTFGLTDARIFAQGKTLAEIFGLTDSRSSVASLVRSVADTLGLTDARALAQGKALAETFGLTDGRTLTTGKGVSLAETFGLTDARTFARLKALAEILGLTDARSFARGEAQPPETFGLSDSVSVVLTPGGTAVSLPPFTSEQGGQLISTPGGAAGSSSAGAGSSEQRGRMGNG